MEPKKELKWRMHQRKGAIMKPSTFSHIVKGAEKRYHIGKARATKIAGKAYWTTVREEYKERHH